MIIIPTGYTYTCTAEGISFKIVKCEHCEYVYVYKMTRTAIGSVSTGFSEDSYSAGQQASTHAHFQLAQKLREDCDAVPCLECGKYQANMVSALRRDFMLGVLYFSYFFLILGAISLAIAWISSKDPTHTADTKMWL